MITLSYLNLITSEFRDQPKFISMLTQIFEQFVSASNTMDYINVGLSIDMAEGKQLDILGQYLGQSRKLSTDIVGLDGNLNDDDFRFLLKAKIAQAAWDGTIEGIERLWSELFGEVGLTIVDNQDMSCQFIINPGGLTDIQVEMISSGLIIPKPAGVKYTYQFMTKVLFAYDLNTDDFAGYDTGYWNGVS